MSSELEARFWWPQPLSLPERLAQLTAGLSAAAPQLKWLDTTASTRFPPETLAVTSGVPAAAQLASTLQVSSSSKRVQATFLSALLAF